jgi:hypothetical protein
MQFLNSTNSYKEESYLSKNFFRELFILFCETLHFGHPHLLFLIDLGTASHSCPQLLHLINVLLLAPVYSPISSKNGNFS